jgi:aminopeptidase N
MRRLLALLACFAVGAVSADAQVPDNAMGKGVSLELAQWRTRTIRQVRIDLRLDVTSLDSAPGHVTLSFDRSGPDDAVIDFRGRRITRIIANGADLPSSIFNGAHLRIPAANLRTGENAIAVDFVSEIAPSGTSIIRTHDQTDNSDYLYTLLVPADANQLFPSFDQPDLKARVTFSLVAPRAWTTLANGSEHAADTTNDRITHYFTETKPLSTYLIAFAAGPWQKATSTVNGRPISVYLRKSRFNEADTDTLLALSHRAVTWMEQYFDRPYPFEKIDFLLAPAFPFGGMEHPGAIFYNETGFIFRERPTLTRRLGRFSTILHETAHQWFGDLVTMRWFDDLWLKEGFATYMAAKAQFALDSTSGAWKTFHSNKPTAYAVDQTTGTNSLVQKLVNLDQAKSNYGPIVYNKAPSTETAQLPDWRTRFSAGRPRVPRNARVRERDVAGFARCDRHGGEQADGSVRAKLHAPCGNARRGTTADRAQQPDYEARTRAASGTAAVGQRAVADAHTGTAVVWKGAHSGDDSR